MQTTSNGHVNVEGLLNRLKVQRDFLEAAQATSARRLHQLNEIKRVLKRDGGSSGAKLREVEKILDGLR
jgi:hypothetical protein